MAKKEEAKIIVLLSLVKCAVGVKFQNHELSPLLTLFLTKTQNDLCAISFWQKLPHTLTPYLSPNSFLLHFHSTGMRLYLLYNYIVFCKLLHCG